MYRYSLPLQLFVALLLLLCPAVIFAQSGGTDSLQGYIVLILRFINNIILPFIFSLALLFFLVHAARYFIIQSGDSESREKSKSLALYGIGAFVIMVSIWGIVNVFVFGLSIDGEEALCPDYLGDWCDGGGYNGYQDDYFSPLQYNFTSERSDYSDYSQYNTPREQGPGPGMR